MCATSLLHIYFSDEAKDESCKRVVERVSEWVSETAETLYYEWMFPDTRTAFIWPLYVPLPCFTAYYIYILPLQTTMLSGEWCCNSVLHNIAIYQWHLNFSCIHIVFYWPGCHLCNLRISKKEKIALEQVRNYFMLYGSKLIVIICIFNFYYSRVVLR